MWITASRPKVGNMKMFTHITKALQLWAQKVKGLNINGNWKPINITVNRVYNVLLVMVNPDQGGGDSKRR